MRLKTALLLLILFPLLLCAQEPHFKYKLKLQGVTDLASAKEITDPLRQKFLCNTPFKLDEQRFEFVSAVNINENQLQVYLDTYGYTIVEFSKLPVQAQGEGTLQHID